VLFIQMPRIRFALFASLIYFHHNLPQEFFSEVAAKVDLKQKEPFALAYPVGAIEKYLEGDAKIGEFAQLFHRVLGIMGFVVVKMRYLKMPVAIDDVTLHLMYSQVSGVVLAGSHPPIPIIQVQQSILTELWPCTERLAIELAALQVHAAFGDYNPAKHKTGFLKYVAFPSTFPPSFPPSSHCPAHEESP